jgi:hypothetical protein
MRFILRILLVVTAAAEKNLRVEKSSRRDRVRLRKWTSTGTARPASAHRYWGWTNDIPFKTSASVS